MLSVTLNTYDGECYELPMLVEWDLIYTGGVPCDSMTVICLYDEGMANVLPKATRFTASQDSSTVLRGVVDAYEISMSDQGLLVTVEGRGMAALLLDNESEAVTYGRATTSDILQRHVAVYGITVSEPRNLSGNNYAVTSGSSQWKALQAFTHRFGGFDPYFDPSGTLHIAPLWGSGNTITVRDSSPLLRFHKREQRYGVISEMLIQDKIQGISHRVVNSDFAAKGGLRRHVLYMPRSTAGERRYTGEYQIQQSALEQLEMELEFPFAFAAFPGDRVDLALDRLGLSGIYDVVTSRTRMNGDGLRTILTISER